MAVGQKVLFIDADKLWLDPTNPRLGRRQTSPLKGQGKLLELMQDWNLEELATSFVESGFWTQEAVIVVKELHSGRQRLVVVEGNRRIAAIKTLREAVKGSSSAGFWERLAVEYAESRQGDEASKHADSDKLFTQVPYYLADTRADVDAYLGFRHVTGIKQWDPAEKAEYIGRLVDTRKMSFDEVRRAIGSKTPTVRLNYIAYRILLQFDYAETRVPIEKVEDRFSVMYLALREASVRKFLGLSESGEPRRLRNPVPVAKLENLELFGVWLFGTKTKPPLFTDSRRVSEFSRALANRDAVRYLRTARNPTLDQALRHSGLELEDVLESIKAATDEVEQALSRVHLYVDDDDLLEAVERFSASAIELLKKFSIKISD